MPSVQASLRLSLKNILFATDFSTASDNALPYALALARSYEWTVIVAHAVPPEPVMGVPMEPVPESFDLEWNRAQKRMNSFMTSNPLQDIPHQAILQQGELWNVMSKLIAQHDVDLIVLGTHGREGIKKVVLGSAAEQVFRRSPCPVLTVGPHVKVRQNVENWRCIVFATDFSEGSLHALPFALSLAEENQATLVLLHAVPLAPIQEQENIRQSLVNRLRALVPLEASAWCTPDCVVRFDFPNDSILKVAQERDADLIVMGVRKSATPRLTAHLPWAIASDVVCRASCPVLTVRA